MDVGNLLVDPDAGTDSVEVYGSAANNEILIARSTQVVGAAGVAVDAQIGLESIFIDTANSEAIVVDRFRAWR
jgi:hypothetical protein